MSDPTQKDPIRGLEGTVGLEITGGGGAITTRTEARCYYKNGSYYLLFEENLGEDEGAGAMRFSSRLKISPREVTLRRSALGEEKAAKTTMEMIYRQGTSYGQGTILDYPSPYGVLRMEIRTDSLERREEAGELKLRIRYRLLQEGKEVSNDKITIRVFCLET